MILKGNELREKFNEQMQKIEMISRDFAEFLNDKGIEESCAEEFLTYFASDNSLPELETAYKDMLGEHIGIEYFKAAKSISNISDIIEIYEVFAVIAWQKKIPVAEFIKILDGKEAFEIQEELEQYIYEQEEENLQSEQKEVQPEIKEKVYEEKVDEKKQEPHIEVVEPYKSQVEKNFFTQMIEDLLGVSTDDLENEVHDGNLDNLVKSITDAISEDKRKTNLINNLRKIVILANKQLVLMTDRINNCAAVESELRNQIYCIAQERDEYKKKYEDLNSKISELTSLTAFTGGTKRID